VYIASSNICPFCKDTGSTDGVRKAAFRDFQITQTRSDNLTKNERLALTNLAKRTDIVINKADKGSTIVVQDREQYVQDGLSRLANETVYKPLTL